ncbi:MAG TPA: hypothetical protein VM938_04215 [Acidimicrobiales bacterium]|nr:hypothetical protein [Acidimicrobiales bacterium]
MSDDIVPAANEADAMEQEQLLQDPLAEGAVDVDLGIVPDANEADLIEQAQPGPLLDEDEARE